MVSANAISAADAQSSNFFSTFDPDLLDPITDALINAREVDEVVQSRHSFGGGGDAAIRLAMEEDPVETLARIYVLRQERDYSTERPYLIVLGFTPQQLDEHGPAAHKRASQILAARFQARLDTSPEDIAPAECALAAHAGGQG